MRHSLSYCSTCRCSMVICGHCGNNCCNGGSGDGCPDRCFSAYEYQGRLWASGQFSVKPKKGRGQRRNRRNR